jgi:Fuc2NAc and GlcNAc transferase
VPTPRNRGVAIVLVVLASFLLLATGRVVDRTLALALGGDGALVALVGCLDDRRGVTSGARFIIHVLVAAWAMGMARWDPPS